MQGACYGMPMQVASRPMVDRANRSGRVFQGRQPVVLLGAQAEDGAAAAPCRIATPGMRRRRS